MFAVAVTERLTIYYCSLVVFNYKYCGAVYSALETARDCQVRRPTSTSRPGPPTYRSSPTPLLAVTAATTATVPNRCRSSFNSSNCWKDYVLQHAKYILSLIPKFKDVYTRLPDRCCSVGLLYFFHSFSMGRIVVNETETCCGVPLKY